MAENRLPKQGELTKEILQILENEEFLTKKQIKYIINWNIDFKKYEMSPEEREKYKANVDITLNDLVDAKLLEIDPISDEYQITDSGLEFIEKYDYEVPKEVIDFRKALYSEDETKKRAELDKFSLEPLEEVEEIPDEKLPIEDDETMVPEEKTSEEDLKAFEEEISEDTPAEIMEKIHSILNKEALEELEKILKDLDIEKMRELVDELIRKLVGEQDFEEIRHLRISEEIFDSVLFTKKNYRHILFNNSKYDTVNAVKIEQYAEYLRDTKVNLGILISKTPVTLEAQKHAKNKNIILISWQEFLQFLVDNNIGIKTKYTFEIKEVDREWFGN